MAQHCHCHTTTSSAAVIARRMGRTCWSGLPATVVGTLVHQVAEAGLKEGSHWLGGQRWLAQQNHEEAAVGSRR